jgi:tetratricopeptide (TPR) repeat protein
MAKDPAGRFGTAAEVLAAIRDVATQSRTSTAGRGLRSMVAKHRRTAWAIAAIVMVLALAGWNLLARRSLALEDVPASARRWYEQGAEAVREGAYTKARRALEQAIAQHDRFPLAHARLAEALDELDESGPAKTALLKVHDLVPDPAVLDRADRLRLAGINATVVRDLPKAVASYTELTTVLTNSADVYVDLGRVLQRSGKRDEALAAYRRGLELDRESAAAHLRLGVILGERGDMRGAEEGFSRARKIYETASNTEGVVETLLARGTWLNAHDRLSEARRDLEHAVRLSTDVGLEHQRVRAMLQLSSLTASEGHFKEAEAMATLAIERARTADMDGLAASSLIDLGNVLFAKGQRTEADGIFARAEEIATRRGARRTEARAALSRGSVLVSLGKSREAIPFIERGLAFYKEGGYEQSQRLGLTLLASAYAGTGELERSRAAYEQVLEALRKADDAAGTAVTSERLSGVLLDMGRLPEAMQALQVSLELNRRAGNQLALAFNLTRETELLARLGRLPEAAKKLADLRNALRAGNESIVARAASVSLAGARVALISNNWRRALAEASQAVNLMPPDQPSAKLNAELFASLALARLGRSRESIADARLALSHAEGLNNPRALITVRELVASIFSAAGDHDAAHAAAEAATKLAAAIPNHEASWRLESMAAISAAANKSTDAQAHRSAAANHLKALQDSWGAEAFAAYNSRPDVMELRRRVGK